MSSHFTWADWLVLLSYFVVLTVLGWHFSRARVQNTRDYFLGGKNMPVWAVAISVIAASYSAATFLGGPDQGYRSDLSYLATLIGALLAAIFVAFVLIPRFYRFRVATVYELLEVRFGSSAKKQAGTLFLIGRVFASGARLYMAAIAVSMILFGDIAALHIVLSVVTLSLFAVTYTIAGGIRSIIYTDSFQTAIFVVAAITVIYLLLRAIPADFSQIFEALRHPIEGGPSKLTVLDFRVSIDHASVFGFWSAISGFFLLNVAAFGLDQDMTQQLLTCKSKTESARAILFTVVLSFPIMLMFLVIGLLLYIYYQRPDLMGGTPQSAFSDHYSGEKITVFMHYILTELPAGIRGLVTAGVIAAAMSTLNSAYNSMSSVFVHDLYKPYQLLRFRHRTEQHYVRVGRMGMGVAALLLAAMAILCFYWQRYSDTPLLQFALSVMVFTYSGLIGVYFTAVLTKRGNARSVALAFATGFLVAVMFQPYVLDATRLTDVFPSMAFTWQLCLASLLAFLVAVSGSAQRDPVQQTDLVVQELA